MHDTKRDHTHTFPLTVERERPAARTPAAIDAPPHGHVVGHGPGDPIPRALVGHPRGHVVGHGPGDPTPVTLDGRPHGHVVGHKAADRVRPSSVEGRAVAPVTAGFGRRRTADRKAA